MAGGFAQADHGKDTRLRRLAVDVDEVTPAPIRALLDELQLITDKTRWGCRCGGDSSRSARQHGQGRGSVHPVAGVRLSSPGTSA